MQPQIFTRVKPKSPFSIFDSKWNFPTDCLIATDEMPQFYVESLQRGLEEGS